MPCEYCGHHRITVRARIFGRYFARLCDECNDYLKGKKMPKVYLQSKNESITPTTLETAVAMSSVEDNGRILEVSIQAAAANTGSIHIRKLATGDFSELAAGKVAVFNVNNLAELVAYADTTANIAECIIHTTY